MKLHSWKLLLIVTVMIIFTTTTYICNLNWWYYIISLVIFPFITWLALEIILFLRRNE